MKKWILAALIVPWMAGGALAQFAGLPIAGGVEPIPSLRAWVGGGAMLTADFDLYGLRGDLGIVKNFSLFADLGLVDPDFGSTDWAYQGGGWFILPVDMPLDVAVRGAIGEARYDVHGGSVRLHTYNAGVVASKRVGILVPYTFFALCTREAAAPGARAQRGAGPQCPGLDRAPASATEPASRRHPRRHPGAGAGHFIVHARRGSAHGPPVARRWPGSCGCRLGNREPRARTP